MRPKYSFFFAAEDWIQARATSIAQQAYLRTHQPPVLAMWGKNDSFFVPPGAEVFKRDVPVAEVRFVDSGHFALETHAREIGAAMRELFGNHIGWPSAV